MPRPPQPPEGFDSLVERRIRQAMEAGEFDELPGEGQPIRGLERPYDPEWWAKQFVRRERLQEALRTEDAVGMTARIAEAYRAHAQRQSGDDSPA